MHHPDEIRQRRSEQVLIRASVVLPASDSLRNFVVAITCDHATPIAVRNASHLLMIAIERNDAHLVEASLSELHRVAELEGYDLLPL